MYVCTYLYYLSKDGVSNAQVSQITQIDLVSNAGWTMCPLQCLLKSDPLIFLLTKKEKNLCFIQFEKAQLLWTIFCNTYNNILLLYTLIQNYAKDRPICSQVVWTMVSKNIAHLQWSYIVMNINKYCKGVPVCSYGLLLYMFIHL